MTRQSLGGYRLDALLGPGGMGEVYRSHDAKLGRDVAIKILPSGIHEPSRSTRAFRARRADARRAERSNISAISRLYGGIHYRVGNEAGLAQGRCTGATVLQRVQFLH